jgi:acetylornithine deacetylase
MRQIDPAAGIEFIHVNSIPALAEARESAVFGMALDLLDDKTVEKGSFGSEAGFFQVYGVPAIVCGPGCIEQAHTADEFVDLDQLAICDRFISGVTRRLSGNP